VDGKSLAGMSPLKAYLRADRSTDFAYGFSRHMLSYALGRQLSYRDEATVRELQAVFEQDGFKMRTLIKAIVNSPVFKETL
jgi:hypothetical protein